jgi:3',5'-cyclic AMP phosphodiesterase CpdA
METTRIVHLSDLHLGNDLVMRSLKQRRAWWGVDDLDLLDNLADAIRDAKPDYVIITGDVVNKSCKKTFKSAVASLQRLFQRAHVDISRQVLIIPGNHDVKVKPPSHRYLAHVPQFLDFLKHFFGEHTYRPRTERFVKIDPARQICFYALDSTMKGRGTVQMADGVVGDAQWDWLERKHREAAQTVSSYDRFVKIVALHHHPHEIDGAGPTRFLQLTDAAEAHRAFRSIGANLVLHGHRHYPHCSRQAFEQGHYHVVGAGTACLRFPEEQAGHGNNFNVIILKPSNNLVEVERWKADGNKKFGIETTVKRELFPSGGLSYRMRDYQSLVRITDLDGSCLSSDRRLCLGAVSAEADGKRKIAFYLKGLPAGSAIEDFVWEPGVVTDVEYTSKEPRCYEGYLILGEPLKWGGDPVDLGYTFRISKAFRMWKAENETDAMEPESVDVEIIHPCDQVTLTVEFPESYKVQVQARVLNEDKELVSHSGQVQTPQYDPLFNRYSWVVRAPRMRFVYSLWWKPLERPVSRRTGLT